MEIRLKVLEFVLWAEHIAYDKGGMTYQFGSRQDYLPTLMKTDELDILKTWFQEKIADASRNSLGKREENRIVLSRCLKNISGIISIKIFLWMRCRG